MKFLKWAGATCLAAALLVWPETALNAARSAMYTWATSVAPALFPFMALMPLLTGKEAVLVYRKLFGRIMQPLFGLPGAFAPAVVIAMTAGSPAGAEAAVRIAARTGMGRKTLGRAMACVCGAGPAFLIGGVGASMLGDAGAGQTLLKSQILTQLTLLMFLSRGKSGEPVCAESETGESDGVRSAAAGLLAVCGYMMIFNTVAALIARALNNAGASLAVLCLLDLPSGAKALSQIGLSCDKRMILLAGVTGFGGLCINTQNLAICRKMGVRPGGYLLIRAASGMLCAAITAFQNKITLPGTFNLGRPMAFSALIACFFAVPALISLGNTLFLNKRKSDKILLKTPENR